MIDPFKVTWIYSVKTDPKAREGPKQFTSYEIQPAMVAASSELTPAVVALIRERLSSGEGFITPFAFKDLSEEDVASVFAASMRKEIDMTGGRYTRHATSWRPTALLLRMLREVRENSVHPGFIERVCAAEGCRSKSTSSTRVLRLGRSTYLCVQCAPLVCRGEKKLKDENKRVFTVKHSSEADRDHAKSVRQYAFTRPDAQDDTIYVALAWFDLPSGFKFGILAHELGHHLAHPDGSEPAADAAFERATGYPIERRDAAEFGKNLEWISADAQEAMFKLFEFEGLE